MHALSSCRGGACPMAPRGDRTKAGCGGEQAPALRELPGATMQLSMTPVGTLYGVGVGPGDPELLTLKGLRILQSVSTIFTPVSRSGGSSLARAIVSEHLDLEQK